MDILAPRFDYADKNKEMQGKRWKEVGSLSDLWSSPANLGFLSPLCEREMMFHLIQAIVVLGLVVTTA